MNKKSNAYNKKLKEIIKRLEAKSAVNQPKAS